MNKLMNFLLVSIISFSVLSCAGRRITCDLPGDSKSTADATRVGTSASNRQPAGMVVQSYPMLEKLQQQGYTLAPATTKWMEKWKGVDLEDHDQYRFPELKGKTSINLKVEKKDDKDPEGYKGIGNFLPENSAGNPNTELAYFHLAAIVKRDQYFRPSVPYTIGPKTTAVFKNMMEKLVFEVKKSTEQKRANRVNLLADINAGKPLQGCIKAKDPDGEKELDNISGPSTTKIKNALLSANPLPPTTATVDFGNNLKGSVIALAKQYSVIAIFDALFEQEDRTSGGNISVIPDKSGQAIFHFSDNGGSHLAMPVKVAENLNSVTRF